MSAPRIVETPAVVNNAFNIQRDLLSRQAMRISRTRGICLEPGGSVRATGASKVQQNCAELIRQFSLAGSVCCNARRAQFVRS
jgi:hypothetical protein